MLSLMKKFRHVALSTLIACLATAPLAADTSAAADPSGTWTYTLATPNGRSMESTLVLSYKDGKLSGTVDNRAGKTEIENASFENGTVSFDVHRERRRAKSDAHYEGKMEDNTITGTVTIEIPKRDESYSSDWTALRKQ